MPAWLVLTRKKSDGSTERTCSPWPEQGIPEAELAKLKAEGWEISHPDRRPETTREGPEVKTE